MTVDTVETENEPGFDLFAKFDLSFKSLKQELVAQRQLIQQWLADQPRYVSLVNSVTLSGTATNFIDLGTPQDGRQWTVRLLGASPQGGEGAVPAAANGTIVWYVGSLVAGITSQFRWIQTPIPKSDTFTSTSIQVKAKEHLFAVVFGGTVSVNIEGFAAIQDEPIARAFPIVQN